MKEKSCGAIVINNGKVLLIQSNEGYYGFPKGHIEHGETEQETAIREVKEETNVDIEIDSNRRYCISYMINNNVLKEVVYFKAHPIGIPRIIEQENEIKQALFVPAKDVHNYLQFDNIRHLWEQFYNEYGIIKEESGR